MLLGPAEAGRLQKPLLVIMIVRTLETRPDNRATADPIAPLVPADRRRAFRRRPRTSRLCYTQAGLVSLADPSAATSRPQIIRVIKDANSRLKRTRYGPDALSISIAQVGTDLEAQDFLGRIDEDRTIGDLVDCTSGYELESEEIRRKTGKQCVGFCSLLCFLSTNADSRARFSG
jgi:hypothetical protein